MSDYSGADINKVLRLVDSLSPRGDVQLSILTMTLAVACRSCGIDQAVALEEFERCLNHPVELIPLNG